MRKILLLVSLFLFIHFGVVAAEINAVNCHGTGNVCAGIVKELTVNQGYTAKEVQSIINFILISVLVFAALILIFLKRIFKHHPKPEDFRKIVADAVKAADNRADKRHKADATTIEHLTEAVKALGEGRIDAKQSQIDKALSELRKGDFSLVLSLFQANAEKNEREIQKLAEIQRHMGALTAFTDTEKSLQSYQRATQLAPQDIQNWDQYGDSLNRIGQRNEAVAAYDKALDLGQELGDKRAIEVACNKKGNIHKENGDLDKAAECYKEASKISKNPQNERDMAIDYCNLGNVAFMIDNDLDKAMEYYEKALEINQRIKSEEGIAAVYGNIGNIYDERGNLSKALMFHKKSLRLTEKLGIKEYEATTYRNIGHIYLKRKEYKRAMEAWKKSLHLYEAIDFLHAQEVRGFLSLLPKDEVENPTSPATASTTTHS